MTTDADNNNNKNTTPEPNTVNFIDGKENKLTIEPDLDNVSPLLKKQYHKAHTIYKKIFGLKDDYTDSDNKSESQSLETLRNNNINNIIAFCGDRGTGKTSCMESFRAQINNKDKDVVILDTIDPSFFDDNHNILQLILGQIYKSIQKRHENDQVKNYLEFNYSERVLIELNKAINYLKYLAKAGEKPNHYDGMEELEYLAAGIHLQESISNVIKEYLAFYNKKRLIISIDDIDLNTKDAYIMAEHIRKYLNIENCVVLLSVNVDQLTDIIKIQMEADKAPATESYNMAVKYITKFMPLGNRVFMPSLYNYCNMPMTYTVGKEKPIEFNSVKEAVTLLIFWKTGYLFYNSKGSSSLIVPQSLRQLRQLLHLLAPLHDIYDETDNKIPLEKIRDNQFIFKNYFYYTWTKMFNDEYRNRINKIISHTHNLSLNKTVVSILNGIVKLDDKEGFKDICNSAAYAYNVSLGDVMRIVEYLSRDESDNQLQAFLFFIRSFYSMLLYEAYDDKLHELVEPAIESNYNKGEIYATDPLFNSINNLQQIVNGQYFSFNPSDYLAPHEKSDYIAFTEKVEDEEPIGKSDDENKKIKINRGIDNRFIARDKRLINGQELFDELDRIIKKDHKGDLDDSDKFQFNILEYFILSISRGVGLKNKNARWRKHRESNIPVHLSLNGTKKHLVFDVLAPFFNVLNLKTTYNRFEIPALKEFDYNISLYDYAYEREWTLLYNLLNRKSNDPNNDKKGEHLFIRDAIIRNAEILSAIGESLKALRIKSRATDDKDHIAEFYKDLTNLGMKIYPDRYTDNNKVSHSKIEYKFLQTICEVLKKCKDEYFYSIFNSTLMFEPEDPSPSYIFTKNTYKPSTITALLKEFYPDIYKQKKLKEWAEIFPKDKNIPSENIISVIKELLDNE